MLAVEVVEGPWVSCMMMRGKNKVRRLGVHCTVSTTIQRPYLINFDATGSPCHELTS